jgi:hypothetical protein
VVRAGDDVQGQEEDLRALLIGENGDGEDYALAEKGDQDLQELVLRLRINGGDVVRAGRHRPTRNE